MFSLFLMTTFNDLPLDPEWVLPLRKNLRGELEFDIPFHFQLSHDNPQKEKLRKAYKEKYPIWREQEPGKGFKPIPVLDGFTGKRPKDPSPIEKELVKLLKDKKNEYEKIEELANLKAELKRQIEDIDEQIKASRHEIHAITAHINCVSDSLIKLNQQILDYDLFQDWF